MKRLCLILLGLTFVSIMKADGEFPYLTFVGSDGTVTSLGVESLEMTVTEDGNLVAVNGDGSKTLLWQRCISRQAMRAQPAESA